MIAIIVMALGLIILDSGHGLVEKLLGAALIIQAITMAVKG